MSVPPVVCLCLSVTARFWCSTSSIQNTQGTAALYNNQRQTITFDHKPIYHSVRFVRDAQTASTNDYPNTITIYPNPTTSVVTYKEVNNTISWFTPYKVKFGAYRKHD